MADSKVMNISVLAEERIEMGIVQNGVLEEYYVELFNQKKTRGNIYVGVVNNIDTSLQAAFINYGAERNGFLQIDEIHPEYFHVQQSESSGRPRFPPIQNVMRKGDLVLVQVVKEPTGKKGAFLTTYLSFPGRYFVLTIGREQVGISRKITDENVRKDLRELVQKQDLGPGLGVIVRTAAASASKTRLIRDLKILKKLWTNARDSAQKSTPPSQLFAEIDLSGRAIRDYMDNDITEVYVDHEETIERVRELMQIIAPRRLNRLKYYNLREQGKSWWESNHVDKQVQALYSREVTLPSGGRLVFDTTEALTAVDINSGKIGGKTNFRDMALLTNIEAAREIARQIRLRDIGGQIVIDFIEMKDKSHCRDVERTMRLEVKKDRARTDVGRLSRFGLLELVRQRLGSSALSTSTESCPHCGGTGVRRNLEWQAVNAIRELYAKIWAHTPTQGTPSPTVLNYECHPDIMHYLLNNKLSKLHNMETEHNVKFSFIPKV